MDGLYQKTQFPTNLMLKDETRKKINLKIIRGKKKQSKEWESNLTWQKNQRRMKLQKINQF